MMRLWSDGKTDRAIMDWSKNFRRVRRITAVEKQEESPIFILPVSIELNQEPVRFCTSNEVIMETDALTRNEAMSCDIDPLTQNSPEEISNTQPHCRQEIGGL